MNWLQRHKLNGLGLTFLLLIFILSVYVRQENLKAPLQSEEWITAHTLITAEIWDENGGPSAFGFNPIYNYPGHGNAYRSALGGIVAENGEVYYVSYPPFTFLFYYYVSHVVGGPSVQSIRIISLLIHFLTSLLIFFLVQKIRSKKNQNAFNYGGIIAAGLYLFAKGNLRFHGNLYFADTLVQPLFIGCILLSLHYYKGEFKRENRTLIALFIVFFFTTYTEWIGLLTAFITGLFFLIKAIAHRNKHLLKPFFTIGIASSLALAITIAQYSSIDGWESLKTTTSTKYAERSGYDDQTNSAKEFNIHNSDTFSFLLKNFNANYEHTLNYFGFTTVLFLLFLLLRKFIKKPIEAIQQTNKPSFFVLTILILPLLLHYLLLFNFNAMQKHYSNALKLEQQGFISKGQRMQFEVARNNAERTLQNAQANLNASQFSLNNLLHQQSNPDLSTPLFVNTVRSQSLESLLSSYSQKSSLVQKMQLDTQLANANIQAQQAAKKPSLFSFGEYSLDENENWIVGVMAKYNLFSGVDKNKNIHAAELKRYASELMTERTKQEIEALLNKSYNELNSAQQSHTLLQRNINAAQENLRIQELSFREGMGTATQVIDAQNALSALKTEMALNAYKYVMSLATLLQSHGSMDQFKAYVTQPHTDYIR